MPTSKIDIDDDKKHEIIVKGGVVFVGIVTVAIADILITGGENLRWATGGLADFLTNQF